MANAEIQGPELSLLLDSQSIGQITKW